MEPVKRLADSAEELAAKYGDVSFDRTDEDISAADEKLSEVSDADERIIDTADIGKLFAAERAERSAAEAEEPVFEQDADDTYAEDHTGPDIAQAKEPDTADYTDLDIAEEEPTAEDHTEQEIAEEEPDTEDYTALDIEEPATEDHTEPDMTEEEPDTADGTDVVPPAADAEGSSDESPDTDPDARSEKKTRKKKKMHPLLKVLIALLIIVALAAAAVGIATYTKYITWFEDGPMISDKEDLTMQLDAENLEKLNNFKNLKHVDLTGSPAGFEAVKAWADAHPNVDVDYMVDIPENATFDVSTGLVDFTKLDAASAIANIEGVQQLLKGKAVKIDPDTWSADDIEAFCSKLTRFELVSAKKTFKNADVDTIRRYMAAVPHFEFDGTVALDNIEASITETTMDFTELSDEGLKVLDEFLGVLPVYKEIDLGSEFAHDRLPTIYDFYKDHLDITVHYEFGVMGQRHDINDTILDFNHIYMRDQGAEVREVIACMPHLRILDMDWCLVDNAHMEAMRNDFPNVDIEWRLWFPSNRYYSIRTDAEKIFLSAFGGGMLTDADCEQLKYCTKVKYMDIGHNEYLTDASFLANMPDLEVLVLSINLISDISGLANCPHLEYMEMFNTRITNLDALAGCTELKHLNICQNRYLTDITGVYGLSGLERFWVGDAYSTSVPREQVAKFKELNPDTFTCDYTYGAHTAGWRTGERYALLWKQMGYGEEDSEYSYYWLDPENPSHPRWTKYSEENGYTAENGYWNKYPVLQTGMWF